MKKAFVLSPLLLALSPPAAAQAGSPNLQRYDQCIAGQVRARVPAGQRVTDAQEEGIARAAVTSCQALLPAAVSDYQQLTLSMVRKTPYAAQAAKASDDQWRAKLVALRIDMARGLVVVAAPRPADTSRIDAN